MFRFMDHTRKVAVGAALAAFMVSQTALPGSVANAVFVDQVTPVISEALPEQSLNVAGASGLVPRVSIEDSRISVGETIEVPITLSSAPEGLAGFYLMLDMGDSNTARIVSVEFPDFGMVFEQPGYGNAVRLAAVDVFQTAESNSTDITLAVVTFEGVSAGSIGAQLTIMQIDDDEGNPLPASVSSGTVSVY